MRWSERRRRLTDGLLNQPAPPSWSDTARSTFGSPWLELVMRAGAAVDAAEHGCTTSEIELVREAVDEMWSLALNAQAEHRQANGDPGLARRLAHAHAQLTAVVVEVESMVTSRSLLGDRPVELADRVRALRLASAELDVADGTRSG